MNSSRAGKASKEHATEQGHGPAERRAPQPASTGMHGDVLNLQRSAGNRAVNEALKSGAVNSGPIQGKLTISQPGDRYEQEADRIADAVMASPRQMADANLEQTGRGGATEEANRMPWNLPALASKTQAQIHSVIRSGGEPLAGEARSFMESRLGQDFSQVRIHRSALAGDLAGQLSARAFTVGNNILFGRGEYHGDPPNQSHLLAHELTHVAQHGAGAPLAVRRAPKPVSSPTGADLYQIVEGIGGLELEGREGKRSFETFVSKLGIGQKEALSKALVEEKSRLQFSASSGFGGKLSFEDRERITQINIALRILNASATNLVAELPTDPKAPTFGALSIKIGPVTQKNPREKALAGSRRRKKTEPKERPETEIARVPTEEDRFTVEGQVDQLLQMDPEAAQRVIGRISDIGHLVSLTKEVNSRPPTDRGEAVRAMLEGRRAEESRRHEAIKQLRQRKAEREEMESIRREENSRRSKKRAERKAQVSRLTGEAPPTSVREAISQLHIARAGATVDPTDFETSTDILGQVSDWLYTLQTPRNIDKHFGLRGYNKSAASVIANNAYAEVSSLHEHVKRISRGGRDRPMSDGQWNLALNAVDAASPYLRTLSGEKSEHDEELFKTTEVAGHIKGAAIASLPALPLLYQGGIAVGSAAASGAPAIVTEAGFLTRLVPVFVRNPQTAVTLLGGQIALKPDFYYGAFEGLVGSIIAVAEVGGPKKFAEKASTPEGAAELAGQILLALLTHGATGGQKGEAVASTPKAQRPAGSKSRPPTSEAAASPSPAKQEKRVDSKGRAADPIDALSAGKIFKPEGTGENIPPIPQLRKKGKFAEKPKGPSELAPSRAGASAQPEGNKTRIAPERRGVDGPSRKGRGAAENHIEGFSNADDLIKFGGERLQIDRSEAERLFQTALYSTNEGNRTGAIGEITEMVRLLREQDVTRVKYVKSQRGLKRRSGKKKNRRADLKVWRKGQDGAEEDELRTIGVQADAESIVSAVRTKVTTITGSREQTQFSAPATTTFTLLQPVPVSEAEKAINIINKRFGPEVTNPLKAKIDPNAQRIVFRIAKQSDGDGASDFVTVVFEQVGGIFKRQ